MQRANSLLTEKPLVRIPNVSCITIQISLQSLKNWRLTWTGHLARTDNVRLPKAVLIGAVRSQSTMKTSWRRDNIGLIPGERMLEWIQPRAWLWFRIAYRDVSYEVTANLTVLQRAESFHRIWKANGLKNDVYSSIDYIDIKINQSSTGVSKPSQHPLSKLASLCDSFLGEDKNKNVEVKIELHFKFELIHPLKNILYVFIYLFVPNRSIIRKKYVKDELADYFCWHHRHLPWYLLFCDVESLIIVISS